MIPAIVARQPMLPRAVVWDVGHVLYDWDPRFLYEKLIPDSARLNWFLENVVTRSWHFQHDAGRPFAETSRELCELFPEEAALIAEFGPRWLETIPGPIPGTHEIVEQLRKAGVPQYGITNFSAEFWEVFRPRERLFDHFIDIVVSGRERIVKPDPAIYQLAKARFGLAENAAIFIDDNFANVEAAREAGWLAHHFKGADALRDELSELGLLA